MSRERPPGRGHVRGYDSSVRAKADSGTGRSEQNLLCEPERETLAGLNFWEARSERKPKKHRTARLSESRRLWHVHTIRVRATKSGSPDPDGASDRSRGARKFSSVGTFSSSPSGSLEVPFVVPFLSPVVVQPQGPFHSREKRVPTRKVLIKSTLHTVQQLQYLKYGHVHVHVELCLHEQ